MTVTLKDVAARAGVSRSAVSRTFTKGASVSDKTRTKVLKAAEELGYSPSMLASSLTTGRTKLIGLISNNFRNPYFLQIFDHLTRALQEAGLRPLLVNLSDEDDPDRSLRMLRQYNVDGVIVASSTLPASFAATFRQAGLPVVHAFGWSSSTPPTHLASIDNVESGRLAARTLLARGYRRIGFLGGPEAASTTQDRLSGLTDELAGAPDAMLTVRFADAYAFAAGQRAMQRALADDPMVEAWFCGDDVIAIGAMAAIRAAGLTVPGDIGLLGLNDMDIAAWDVIGLTTIQQPLRDIVKAAVDMVQAGIENPDLPLQTRLLPCKVVERDSLRPLP